MYTASANYKSTETKSKSEVSQKLHHAKPEHFFCPSMFCFTDEIVAQRVSPQADMWVLTDPVDDNAWFMMGEAPTCPHCGTRLLPTGE